MILEESVRSICNNLYVTTDDGSYGQKGFVTDVLKQLVETGKQYNHIIAIA